MKPKLDAKSLRDLEEDHHLEPITRFSLYFILDNIYDTYNIGGLFRLADALSIEKIYICGESETPPNHKIKKASIGTYKIVPWEYCSTTLEAVEKVRKDVKNVQVISIELDDTAQPYTSISYTSPCALILGNETSGISPEVMQASDAISYIPMFGYNVSMNVIVSAAIAAYHVHTQLFQQPHTKAKTATKETPSP